ncbi:hypothetical protein [Yoonia sp.]|uniref:hypothetical protein n=1 Tax=Yoonia sp. TaxID=2212373 RepID=UPI0023A1B5AE|nr:hypothetical protein [Yoonia sp.]MDE0849832.1 hypothetical protein [Yoonia sp.]
MEIAEVEDRESLQAYLEGLEGDAGRLTARRVAFFVAISVAPVALRFFAGEPSYQNSDLTPLAVLGAYAISGVASTITTPEIAASFDASFDAADAADAAASSADAAASSSDAASAASFAAASASFAASASSSSDAASAAAASFAAASAYFWGDLRIFLMGQRTAPDAPMPAITLDVTHVEDWEQTCILLKADSAVDWTFWITWFDRVLAGKDIHADMLVPILNELTEDDWLGDPAKVNRLFDEVLAVYQGRDADEDQGSKDISKAAYFDFIEVNRQMRAVAFPSDHAAFLDDASRDAFLKASNDIQLGLENWCELARAHLQGRNRPVTGVIAIEQIIDQLTDLGRGEEISLRNMIRLGSNAKRLARGEDLAADLGNDLFEILDEALDDYSNLVRGHLSHALEALEVLRSLELGDTDSGALLASLKNGVAYLATLDTDELLPPDPRTRAVINDMLADLEDEQSEIAEAKTEVARQTRGKRFAEKYGGVSATIGGYVKKAAALTNKGGAKFDEAFKWLKRAENVEKIMEFWDKISGGGTP